MLGKRVVARLERARGVILSSASCQVTSPFPALLLSPSVGGPLTSDWNLIGMSYNNFADARQMDAFRGGRK